ncbi:uncharacterized protein LOC128228956 [Mya arenaria]|uniref:uncharacterized protein LOC128228956 n=1 Tax=Mya arenaria TaxID=6604 RepID=UPI0022DF8A64|nr:uncharacterized protein LOC128228956 [Mya arenaria]XP_052796503.1 uncharacterized protein LOC128228956 [Mya arenaria]
MSSTIIIRKPLKLASDTSLRELENIKTNHKSTQDGLINIKRYVSHSKDAIENWSNHSANISENLDDLQREIGLPVDVVNLPLLHQSQRLQWRSDRHYKERDAGTIRRPYECGEDPLLVHGYRTLFAENGEEDCSVTTSENMTLPTSELEFSEHSDHEDILNSESYRSQTISPFPPVESDEIDKHRKLNEEAEKNKTNTVRNSENNYLKRLKLDRKQASDQRLKDMKTTKKKAHLKRMQTKPKIKEIKDEFFLDSPPPPPSKPRESEQKSVKTILGFRYSYAIEEFYRGQLRGTQLAVLHDVENDPVKEEVLNGWLVKTLGHNVLNMQARTLPSCNPVELRLRRMHARMIRNATRSRTQSYSRSLSRESVRSIASQILMKSTDTFKKLISIDEGRSSHTSYNSEKDTSTPGSTSPLKLPPIKALPVLEELEQPAAPRSISLRLPPIGTEDS